MPEMLVEEDVRTIAPTAFAASVKVPMWSVIEAGYRTVGGEPLRFGMGRALRREEAASSAARQFLRNIFRDPDSRCVTGFVSVCAC